MPGAFWDAAHCICMDRTWRKFVRLQCVRTKRGMARDGCSLMLYWNRPRGKRSPVSASSRGFRAFSRAWDSWWRCGKRFRISCTRTATVARVSTTATRSPCTGANSHSSRFWNPPPHSWSGSKSRPPPTNTPAHTKAATIKATTGCILAAFGEAPIRAAGVYHLLAVPRLGFSTTNLLQRSLLGAGILTWRHGHDNVLAILAVQVFHPQDHLVLLYAELRLFADRKQYRVLFIARPDAVDDLLRLQDVFLAEHFVSFLVRGIGANQFSDHALAAVFVDAAGYGFHLQQFAGLVWFRFPGMSHRSQQHHSQNETCTHKSSSKISIGAAQGGRHPQTAVISVSQEV